MSMDYLVDVYRMKLIGDLNGDKKTHWSRFVVLAFLSNYRSLQEWIVKQVAAWMFFKGFFTTCRKRLLRHREPTGLIKLPYVNRLGHSNDMLISIINENVFRLGDMAMFSSVYAAPNVDNRSFVLDAEQDIHFRLQFPDIRYEEKKDDRGFVLHKNGVRDVTTSCGIVISYTKDQKAIYDYIHKRYGGKTKEKPIALTSVNVLRVTSIRKKMFGTLDNEQISKDFNNVFLEPVVKERISQHIKRFSTPQWYIDRGIPQTLGILLHGVPGCGKTSIIKALAAHFSRDILLIDFKLIRTCDQLRLLFSQKLYNREAEGCGGFSCPYNSCIFVFEDFDCMAENFLQRKNETENARARSSAIETYSEMQRCAMLDMRKLYKRHRTSSTSISKKETNDRKESEAKDEVAPLSDEEDDWEHWKAGEETRRVTLADFLDVLDGIVEMHGRIIVMTTNMRDKIDSALIRPGRIDLDIELKPPSKPLIKDIFFHMYKDHERPILENMWGKHQASVADSVHSTAHVMNACMYMNPTDALNLLK